MGQHDDTSLAAARAASLDVMLTANRDGEVLEIAEGPQHLLEDPAAAVTVHAIWDAPVAEIAQQGVRRALRSRSAHSATTDTLELIFVPQGRNRVLVVARALGTAKAYEAPAGRIDLMDPGTGLPNRAFLLEELEKIAVTQRLKEGRAAVLCLYVEPEQPSLGVLGAGREDELLTKLAARLGGQLRGMNDDDPIDYERYSILARTDFRQFAVVLPDIETGEDAEAVLRRLIDSLQQPATVGTRETSATVSGGLALFPQDGTDAGTLLANAEVAMTDARDSDGASYRFHSGTVRLRSLQRQDIAADLRTALAREAFEIRFLPVVAATDGQPRSAEALLRWPDTVLGTVSTQRIVTTAEHTGVILEIGDWVMRKACNDLNAWRQAGHDRVCVSVNLSGQEFASADLARRVAAILEDCGTDPGHLELEIKEHMVSRDAQQDFAIVRSLKSIGIRLVLDDYGTGACTLTDLSRCPLDAIKIDLSLVASIESNARDRAACTAAIGMAKGLGMRVVAEGVETEIQAEFLREAGCDDFQGFLFAQPLTSDAIIDFLDGGGSKSTRTLIA